MADDHAAARLGRTVGKYTLHRILGAGGMATVYEATHKNGHRVALKMLKPQHAVSDETRARFLREGYAANKVDHPGAVRVLDDEERDDAVFLVLELLDGATLDTFARLHAEDGGMRLPTRTALEVGKQLLDVLEAAHRAGIVHRDIKPENVFLDRAGLVKVLDFGIARIVDPTESSVTKTGRMLGTPAFMPPEQAYGRRSEVDTRSDLWSVGATLFTVITGRVVHEAATTEETLIKAATEPAPKIATIAPDVPAEIAAVIDRALLTDKDARWPSAAAMREALEQAHEEAFGAPIATSVETKALGAASSYEPPRPKRRAHTAIVAGALLAALALVAGTIGARPKTEPPPSSAREPSSVVPAPSEAPSTPPTVLANVSTTPPSEPPKSPPATIPVRTTASVAPKASTTAAPAVSCYDIDEEGRKWPKRCSPNRD